MPIQADPHHTNKNCISRLREGLVVELLYSDANIKSRITPFLIIDDYLVMNVIMHGADPQSKE